MQQSQSSSQEEICELFKNDRSYQRNESEIRKRYITELQIARYTNYGEMLKEQLISAGEDENGRMVFYMVGVKQPENEQFKKLMSHIISKVEPYLSKGFIMIYINTGLLTHFNISKFFQAYQQLPVEYFSRLEGFYILHGNMFIKSWFWFQSNVQTTVLKSKTVYISKLSQLIQYRFFNLDCYSKLPQHTLESDSSHRVLLGLLQEREQHPLHQQTLRNEVQCEIIGLNISDYELNNFGIPVCVDLLVQQLNRPDRLNLEGIFRKNASMITEKKIEDLLVKQQYHKLNTIDDAYAFAGIIKKIFDKMPTPLVPFPTYTTMIKKMREFTDQNQQVDYMRTLLLSIPDLNRRVLLFIVGFFTKVSTYQEQNKMTTYNMAVVFAPCFFRPQQYTMDDFKDAGLVVKICQMIIDNYTQIFPGEKFENYLQINNTINRSNSLKLL